jgi:hypothetical protein
LRMGRRSENGGVGGCFLIGRFCCDTYYYLVFLVERGG